MGLRSIRIGLFIALAVLAQWPARSNASNDWRWMVAPYLWTLSIYGDVRVGQLVVPVDVRFKDLYDKVEFVGEVHAELSRNRLGAVFDVSYARYGEDAIAAGGGTLASTTSYDLDAVFAELFVAYRFDGTMDGGLDVFAGVRYNRQSMDLDITTGRTELSGGYDADWVDPLLGLRGTSDLRKTWWTSLRTDLAGFGAGSKLTWNVVGFVGWHPLRYMDVALGAKYLNVNYDNDESGQGRYRYDVKHTGLILGLVFHNPR